METTKSRFDGIVEVIKQATHERSKKKGVSEAFFTELKTLENQIRWEKIYKIKAQALILEPPTTKDGSSPASSTPDYKSEPIEPSIPGSFTSGQQAYPIKGTEEKIQCSACEGVGKFDCKVCNTKGEDTCPACNGRCEITCTNCRGSRKIKCSKCKGRGYKNKYSSDGSGSTYQAECRTCRGQGQINCRTCNGSGTITCNTCGGKGRVPCPKCDGKGYTTCEVCDGSGEIWKYKEKLFQFSPTEENYVIADNTMKALDDIIKDIPKEVWNTIEETDLSSLTSSSETAKNAIEKIKEFDNSLSSKDVKKRGITVEMTESMTLEGEHQGNTYTIVLAGQAWNFLGKISNLTRGLAPQKDGTWLITNDTFNSMSFQKDLSKMAQGERKDLEKRLKEAEKELSGPQKLVDKLTKDLEKANQNADKLKQKLEKASEKKKDGIKPKVDEAVSIADGISGELKEANEKAEVFRKKIAHIQGLLNALP